MYLVVLLLFVLVGWLVALRLPRETRRPWPRAAWDGPVGDRRTWGVASLLAFLTQWPLLRHLGLFLRTDAVLSGDAASHAIVIQELARHGAPHGWIDAYDGGFPLGVNYPPLGWVVGAALVRIGAPTIPTVQLLGLVPYLAAPVVLVHVARAAGARPVAALTGACALAWISPYNAWLGTFETFLGLGLLSQAMSLPFLLGIAWVAVDGRRPGLLPLLGGGLAASHPQVTFMAALLTLPALALGGRTARRRLGLALAGAAIVGVAVYGPGLVLHRIPFAWTKLGDTWWIVGYRPDRLLRWTLDFELLDQDRGWPLVTSVWLLALVTLLGLCRNRVPRVVLATAVWALALSMLGRGLLGLGDVGAWVISFLQPQRAFSLVPLATAAAIVAASEEILARAPALGSLRRIGRWGPRAVHALFASWLLLGAVDAPVVHAKRLAILAKLEADWLAGGGRCGPLVGARTIVEALPGGGRLSSIEEDGYTYECAKSVGVELRSPRPRGHSSGAGAHVGTNTASFALLLPERPGSAARAEAMGVRWLIHGERHRPLDGGWREIWSSPPFVLSEREGGTDRVGVGCVVAVWRGSSHALQRALLDGLERGSLLDPHRLVAIEQTRGPHTTEAVTPEGCDPRGARVTEIRREPGALEAHVETETTVDVVVRESALATWTIRVDGAASPIRVMAPGFMAVRVGPGRHHVEATVAWPPGYGAGLGGAALVLAVMAWIASRHQAGPGTAARPMVTSG